MSRALTVLHAHSGNLYGGIERVLVTLRRFEAASSVRHRFALSFDGRLRNELGDHVVGMLGRIRRRYPWTALSGRARLRRAVAETRADAVMVHGGWAQALLGPEVVDRGVPLVRWFHGAAAPGDAWEVRASATRPTVALSNSHFTARTVAPFTLGIPNAVVYPPVPRPPEAPEPARSRLRALAGVNPGTTVILHVARLEASKGHGQLVEAAARFPADRDWQVWFVGGPQRAEEFRLLDQVRAQAARLGLGEKVRFLGERHDTASLYAAADLYCQPNTAPDAFGLTFVEALYAGLPIVTSNLGGPAEIVGEGCGVLLPPGDVDALAAALDGLLMSAERRTAMAIAGPARAAELCEPVRQIRLLADVLGRCLP